MDNQHKLIKGYRDLSQAEIDLMNEVKAKAEEVGKLLDRVEVQLYDKYNDLTGHEVNEDLASAFHKADPLGWLSVAKLDLQVGFMKLVRSIAQPTTF